MKFSYIHEIFNLNKYYLDQPNLLNNWFTYVCEKNENDYYHPIKKVLSFKTPISSVVKMNGVIGIAKSYAGYCYRKLANKRPLIKDPIAFFSSAWLYDTYNMDVIIIVRHPAAFVSSLYVANWEFDFNHLLNQPELINDLLLPFKDEIIDYVNRKHDIIDQAILLWNYIYYVALKYRDQYPEWMFVRHEDLSLDPVNGFREIYKKLNLCFTKEIEEKIFEYTNEKNPIEQVLTHGIARNSKKNIFNWKMRLSMSQISRIKEKTHLISENYYSEKEW